MTCDEKDLRVIRLVCTGMTDAEIGKRLNRPTAEVSATVRRICARSGHSSRADLVVAAMLGSWP